MKTGAENRKKTMLAGGLGAAALIAVGYIYTQLFSSGSSTPPPDIAPVATTAGVRPGINSPLNGSSVSAAAPVGPSSVSPGSAAAPGVGARRMATASASLDPTLDESAMLRTEHLLYAGTGRNVFSALYTPPAPRAALPKPIAPIRTAPVVQGPPPPPPTCPPTCPPINLRFFGTAQHGTGARQAFLLQGDNVFLASEGEIVARRYKIVSISSNSVRVEDLTTTDVQTLPLQSN